MIKAVACDIDGTITDEARRLDVEAVRIIREIELMGTPVVLATGNLLHRTETASTFIGTSGPLIAENGGIVKETGKTPRYLCDIKSGEIKEAFEHLTGALNVRMVDGSELRRTEIVIYRDFDVDIIRRVLSDFDVKVVDTKFAIHITDPKVNKGAALSEAAEMMDLKENEFAAIGDGENDYEMLQKSGFGISVAEESLRSVADIVTEQGYGRGGACALGYVRDIIKNERENINNNEVSD